MTLKKKDWLYSDLLEACAEPGCPLCCVGLAHVRRYLDNTLYEGVNDPGVRAELREARGYCDTHAWMLREGRGVVLGIAILQHDVLSQVLEATEVAQRGRNVRKRAQDLLQRLRPAADCPACAYQHKMEDMAIHTFLKYLDDPDLVEALKDTSGLCLAHFSRALELVDDSRQLQSLERYQRQALQRLREELAELIRKHDYRFRGEELGKERDSWLRAIGIVSGEHGLR